jgi:predicted RNase H-like HicB family nuclease
MEWQLSYEDVVMNQVVKMVYWQDEDAWLGYLQEYPDYWSQGETLDDLKEHLKKLYSEMIGGQIPGIRKVDDLVLS